MSNQLDFSRNLELRDAEGHTVGVVLPPETARELTAERDQLRAEVNRLRAHLSEIRSQLDSWKEKAKINEERAAQWEQDWQEIYKLLPAELRLTPEEIAGMQQNGTPFEEVVRELEQMMTSRSEKR